MESPVQRPAAAASTTAKAEKIPLNWNKWVRQIHRWFSMAFTVGVIVNLAAVVTHRYAGWVGLMAGLPLALLLLSGLYLLLLPYATEWRNWRRAD